MQNSVNVTTYSPQERLLAQLEAIPASQMPINGSDWFPPVDIVEEAEEYLFKMDLPEVTPDNLQVAVEADELVISGERANPWQRERKVLRVERPHGYFVRRFALPADAEPRDINTLFAESVLEIRVRKTGAHSRPPVIIPAPPKLKLRLVS